MHVDSSRGCVNVDGPLAARRLQSAARATLQRPRTSTSCNSHWASERHSPEFRPGHPWRELADALRELPEVDTVAIFIVDELEHRLVVARTSGAHARRLEGLSMAVGDRISGWVAATGQPMINAQAGLDLLDVPARRLRAAIAVPCSGPGGAQVVLTLYSAQPDAFSSMHHRLLSAAASFVQSIGSPRKSRIVCVNRERNSHVRWPQRTRRSGLQPRSAASCGTRP